MDCNLEDEFQYQLKFGKILKIGIDFYRVKYYYNNIFIIIKPLKKKSKHKYEFTESRRWWDCDKEFFAEWAFEGNLE